MKFLYKKAFTLIEIMVVVFVFSIIAIITSEFLIAGFKSTKFNEEQETAIQNARNAMEEMTRVIRGANYSERGAYVLSVVNSQEIEFYSDIDFDYQMEKIKYYEEDLKIKRSVVEPTLVTQGGNQIYEYSGVPVVNIIADHLNNSQEPIFTYYNSDMELLVGEIDKNQVRSINIYLKVNVTPSRAPGDYILESSVQLRNLKER